MIEHNIKRNNNRINFFIVIFILSMQLFSQTISGKGWFVDKNATGAATGRTIENAWASFSSVEWVSMADGDTLFISGGADSTFYYEQLTVGRAHITIMPCTIGGHNGKVIIDGQGRRSYGVQNNAYSYVTVYGLDIRNATDANIQLRNSNCTISHNTLYISSGATYGLDIRGSNNIIEYNTSSNSNLQNDGQRDFCQMTTGGHHIFRYNHHTNYNPDPDDHTDFIQCYAPFDDVEIYGNFVVDADEKRSNSNLIYLNGIGGVVKIYNNVIIDQSDSTINGMITVKETSASTDLDTLLIYNNSLYDAGFGVGLNIDASVAGTSVYLALYNNAIRGDAKAKAVYTTNAFSPMSIKSTTTPIINNNITYQTDATRTLSWSYNGTSYTFANWKALGFDTNGLNEAPSYTSITEGAFDLESIMGGNLIGNGTIIKSNFGIEYSVSLNSVDRLTNNWDVGAYQYSSSSSGTEDTTGDLKANVKVFLQGPYDNGSMSTALAESELIPDTQPYNVSPWNYSGSESFNVVPDLAVDWILVELRSASDPSQVVSRRAGLLESNGMIMEMDGTEGITFSNILYGSYYIAVRHRNHLAVMSSSPVLFSPNSDLYDFTTSLSKAYGQDGMIQDTSSGVFMMYSGDGDGNGVINDNDREGVWSEHNGQIGYLNGDFNLDSGVTSKDANGFWNEGKVSNLP